MRDDSKNPTKDSDGHLVKHWLANATWDLSAGHPRLEFGITKQTPISKIVNELCCYNAQRQWEEQVYSYFNSVVVDRCISTSTMIMPCEPGKYYDGCSCIVFVSSSKEPHSIILKLRESGSVVREYKLDPMTPITLTGRESSAMERVFVLNPEHACFLVTFRRVKVN